MNILVVAPYPPTPPLAGGRRRIFEEVKALKRENEVDFVCMTYTDSDETKLVRMAQGLGIRAFSVRRERNPQSNQGLRSRPALVEKFWNVKMKEQVQSLAENIRYDWALAEHCYCSEYLQGASEKTMLTEHNIEYRIFEQIALYDGDLSRAFSLSGRPGELFRNARQELPSLRDYERAVWRTMDVCVAMSKSDAEIIAEVAGANYIQVVPNCPDALNVAHPLREGPPRILFIGALNYFPNVDATIYLLEVILPIVRRERPDVEVVVAGREPEPEFEQFCQRAGVNIIPNPVDIRDLMTSGTILACPLRFGSGTRIKILDAMAAGVPVVATHLAAEGLGVKSGVEILLADSPEEFSEDLLSLLVSDVRRAALAEAALEYLGKQNLRWPVVFKDLEHYLKAGIA